MTGKPALGIFIEINVFNFWKCFCVGAKISNIFPQSNQERKGKRRRKGVGSRRRGRAKERGELEEEEGEERKDTGNSSCVVRGNSSEIHTVPYDSN